MSSISKSLQSINSYPIDVVQIEVVCLNRSLLVTDEYTAVIGASNNYRLATADILRWLSNHPNLVEQEVGINNAPAIKKQMRDDANKIYGELGDPLFTGFNYGFTGDTFNA